MTVSQRFGEGVWLRYEPGDVQAKCTVCEGWEGHWAPRAETSQQEPRPFRRPNPGDTPDPAAVER